MTHIRRRAIPAALFLSSAVATFVLLWAPVGAIPALPTYSAPQVQFSYTQQGWPTQSEVADFNCDNRPDVILSNGLFGSGQVWPVTIALSNGSGGYVNGTSQIFTGAVGTAEHLGKILIEDYNNDGRPDVFIADSGIDGAPYTGRQNHLFLSTADCHLIDASTTHLPQQSDFTHSATVADIDSDGDVDIYVGNIWGANLIPPQIWVNDGTGHFQVAVGLLPAAQTDLDQARYTSSLFVDVNNDGHPDLVLADDQNHNQSVVLLNDGTGHFTNVPGAITQRPFGTTGVPLDVKSTDFDHDGYADLAIEFSKFPSYQGRWIQLLRNNNGNGTFTDQTAARLFPTQADNLLTWLVFVHFVDLDGDGNNDLIGELIGTNGGESHRFYTADNTGVFTDTPFLAGQLNAPFALVDARGDGHRDVLDMRNFGGDLHTANLLSNNSAVTKPGVPQRVRASRNLSGHVRLFWPYVWGATSYEIWRSATPGSAGSLVGTVSATTFDDLSPSGTGYYSVRALNSAGASNYSVQARGTLYAPSGPALPTFGAAQPKFVINQPGRIAISAAADFNCDGRVDVAFVRSVDGTIQDLPVNIVMSDGLGGFSNGTSQIITGPIPGVQFPQRLLVEDFNGDGRPDLFIPSMGPGTAPFNGYQNKMLLSTSDCHLVDATAGLPQQLDNTFSATAADIDDDGDVDLYIGNLYSNAFISPQIWLNDGTGHFSVGGGRLPAAQTDLSLNKYTASLFLDVDADGDADLVLGGDTDFSTPSTVLRNDGTGHFTVLAGAMPAKPFGTNAVAFDVKSADINHDNAPDLVVVYSRGGGSWGQGRWEQVLINNGTGIFADDTASRLPQVTNTTLYDWFAHFVDLDGDGNHDLIAQSIAYTNGHRFFKANSAGVFSGVGFLSGSLTDVFSLIDAKGDGHRDVLNIGYGSATQEIISLVANTGPVVPPGVPLGVRATRNLTGHVRLFWPYVWGATGYEVWRSAVAGSHGTIVGTTTSTSFDDLGISGTSYYQVRAINSAATSDYGAQVRGSAVPAPTPKGVRVDFNGDGNGDAFVYKSTTGSWRRETTQGGGGFSGVNGGWAPGWTIQPAQFNSDLLTDMFVFSTTTGQWFKMLNNGTGFTAQSDGGWWPGWQRYVMDLDGDGISDLFLYDPVTGQWYKCISTPTGFTYFPGGWSPGWQPYALNLNNDAREDLFLINPTTGQWVWVQSESGANFSYPVWGAWAPGWNIYPADFNGDGRSDLLLHNPTIGQYYVCINNGAGFNYQFGSWSLGWKPYVMDLDGNHVADLFLYNTSGQWFELLSDGFSHFTFVGTGGWSPEWSLYPTDFNGDGRTDLLLYSQTTGQYYQAWNLNLGSFAYFNGSWDIGLTILVGAGIR